MSTLDPTKLPVALAGFINDWIYSREWGRILILSIPMWLLLGLGAAVFIGSILDRSALADKYLQLGRIELEKWEKEFAKPEEPDDKQTAETTSAEVSSPDPELVAAENSGESEDKRFAQEQPSRQLSHYAEMLHRRAHLLEPSNRTQFVIGASLWQRGAQSNAKQTLGKIAPRDSSGYPPAHAIMAQICRDEFAKTRNPSLIQEFQHHAEIGMQWSNISPEIIIELTNLLWQQRKFIPALTYLKQAAENHPEFYYLLYDRAKKADQAELANEAKENGIAYYREQLQSAPRTAKYRIQLAQLLLLDSTGEQEAEQVLLDGLRLEPSQSLTRALSEVYRLRFTRQLDSSQGRNVDLQLLEKALQVDSSNPAVAQTVAAMMQTGVRAGEKLEAELNRLLASGKATVSTHALLSEYHLNKGDLTQAMVHLEQVFRQAPLAVKYANNLAYLYAKAGRVDEAEKVAIQTLTLVQRNQLDREPFVDELLDTLGLVFESQKKTNEAISAYEASLKLDPLRIETRKKLIRVYRKTGSEGIAAAHEATIIQIEKNKAAAAKQNEATNSQQSTREANSQQPVLQTVPQAQTPTVVVPPK
jgi:Tetratricopeptide repeat